MRKYLIVECEFKDFSGSRFHFISSFFSIPSIVNIILIKVILCFSIQNIVPNVFDSLINFLNFIIEKRDVVPFNTY
jgi:hypothetical protein